MKHTFIIVLLSCQLSVCPAQVSIEPLQQCLDYIITWHQANNLQELKLLENYKEKKWYNWLPVPGIGYNFLVNRPLITLSMPNFIGFITRQKELKYQQAKTIIQMDARITADTIAFKSGYRELLEIIRQFQQSKTLLHQDSLLVRMKEEENKSLQATSEDVIKSRLAFMEKQLMVASMLRVIYAKVASIETHLHRNFQISVSQ